MSDKPLLKVSRTSHNVSLQKPQFASVKLCVLVFGCFLAIVLFHAAAYY